MKLTIDDKLKEISQIIESIESENNYSYKFENVKQNFQIELIGIKKEFKYNQLSSYNEVFY